MSERIIKKEPDGYHVYSEDGAKHLGGPYATEKQAKKRLEQVEYFKNKGKSMIFTPERRFMPFSEAELRVIEGDNGAKKIVGKAAVFGRMSQNLGGFQEKLHPRAFEKVLKTADVRGLRNHSPDNLLGRTKSGTMRLHTDKDALNYEIDVPETQEGRDTVTSIKRGDLDGSSFSFTVDEGGEEWQDPEEKGGLYTRIVHAVRDLFDVGPVTYPAYLDTSTGARMLGECRSFIHLKESRKQFDQVEAEVVQAAKVKRIRLLRMRLAQNIF